jgi:hypothetical protein
VVACHKIDSSNGLKAKEPQFQHCGFFAILLLLVCLLVGPALTSFARLPAGSIIPVDAVINAGIQPSKPLPAGAVRPVPGRSWPAFFAITRVRG